jgi:hypothetical protein
VDQRLELMHDYWNSKGLSITKKSKAEMFPLCYLNISIYITQFVHTERDENIQ